MRKTKILLSLVSVFIFLQSYASGNYFNSPKQTIPLTDTTASIKVHGACSHCKQRIENAVKTNGVKTAVWNAKTQLLSISFDPSIISLETIQNKIVATGHDLDNKKANDDVYNALPECCHYRENEEPDETLMHHDADSVELVKGIVLEETKKGHFNPLANASVIWHGTNNGVLTDSAGSFSIKRVNDNDKLVVSYTGYDADTIQVTDNNELKIILATQASGIKKLKEVTVTARQRSTYFSALNPIRTQTISSKELLKAACCNLSESFETNPSVDVAYNDGVTGSKQIQLLGLSGNYTQLTVENLPGPRGLATPLGLNSIAGPWIESIELTKGTGSVANGFESIAGQINVELKKPVKEKGLYANVYVNEQGKTDINLNIEKKIAKNWSMGLLLHDNFLTNKNLDFNNDGFRDLPTGNTLSLVNRYQFNNDQGIYAQFGIKVLNDNRTGGETAFDPDKDKKTTNHYGLGIKTERYEAFGKIGYVFPQKKYKSIGLQLAGISHKQNSYFGLTTYDAKQQSFYSNLIYQSVINSTIHKFRAGASFQYDTYDETFNATAYNRNEIVPGAFVEYTFTPNEKFSTIAGFRVDHNNLYGFFATPRLNVRYEPVPGTIIRASVGRGQRTANIFAENMSVFVSARQLNIIAAEAGKAYGLNPEVAWNKGIGVDQKFNLFKREASLGIDFFRNDFTNQVVVDLENAREVKFYNLQGKSFSNSLQAELNMSPLQGFDVRLAYRYFDVKTTYSDKLLQRPFVSSHRGFANLAYSIKGWKFDYTISYNGQKRLPDTKANPVQYQMPAQSPAYVLMNAQISKTIGKKFPMDFYIGAENITNYFQDNIVIAANAPFSQYFDASMIWGPVSGRMIYIGWRMNILP